MTTTFLSKLVKNRNARRIGVFLGAGLLASAEAFAQQAGLGGLCTYAGWIKTAFGIAALIAGLLIILNSMFMKSSALGELLTTVLLGCVLVAGLTQLITSTGLTVSCTI